MYPKLLLLHTRGGVCFRDSLTSASRGEATAPLVGADALLVCGIVV